MRGGSAAAAHRASIFEQVGERRQRVDEGAVVLLAAHDSRHHAREQQQQDQNRRGRHRQHSNRHEQHHREDYDRAELEPGCSDRLLTGAVHVGPGYLGAEVGEDRKIALLGAIGLGRFEALQMLDGGGVERLVGGGDFLALPFDRMRASAKNERQQRAGDQHQCGHPGRQRKRDRHVEDSEHDFAGEYESEIGADADPIDFMGQRVSEIRSAAAAYEQPVRVGNRMVEAAAQMMLDFLLNRISPHALDLSEHGSRANQHHEYAEQQNQRRLHSDRNECVRNHRRVASGFALSGEIKAGHLQGGKQQREADALAQRKQDRHDDHADQMPARDVREHRQIRPQRALRRRVCRFTNRNCPSGTGDATIALNARTLYIASESDTSLQSDRTAGKSAAISLTRAWGGLRRRSDREILRAGSAPSGLIRISSTPIAAKRFR